VFNKILEFGEMAFVRRVKILTLAIMAIQNRGNIRHRLLRGFRGGNSGKHLLNCG
jgi:hypothetical protein